MAKVLVTGGAGFLGSHLVDRLLIAHEVVVLDDLSTGDMKNLQQHEGNSNFHFVKGSITSSDVLSSVMDEVDIVFHLAAQPDIRLSTERPFWDFGINVQGSLLLLEALRQNDINRLVFASSGGTVYGDSDVLPTLEGTPLKPISNYGASKCAVEMYLSSYATLYGLDSVSLRLANIIGPRLTHGVIFDFYEKLKKNPNRLEVLGDGLQEKSYMYVSDAVDAALTLEKGMTSGYTPVNVGSGDRLKVKQIAELVVEELEANQAEIYFTGSKRGWSGDVLKTDLDVSLLKKTGWTQKVPLRKGVKLYVQWLVETFGPLSS
ncbi:MAG: NAD-dependent epimerase/dehydratase family protein [Candidatus Thorarchaeota archaeon]|jgi:UDP-glucose 4-epimerase